MKTAEEFIKEHIPDCHEWADWGMEATVNAMRAYATESCQVAFEQFMVLLTPIMKEIPSDARFKILEAIQKTQPVLP